MGDGPDQESPKWLWIFATALVLAACGLIAVGVVLTIHRQPTPTEQLLISVIMSALSLFAGLIIAMLREHYKEKRQAADKAERKETERKEIERNALSSVRRIFNLMAGFGRIEELAIKAESTEGFNRNNMSTTFQVIAEHARTQRAQAEHSVKDWRYFAPESIDAELDQIRAQRQQPTIEE